MTPTTPDDLGFDPNQVTPGWEGFLATALIGVVVIALMFVFFRQVTRINNRAEARERIEAELAERDAAAAAPVTADASLDAASEPTADARPESPGEEQPRA
ncbi:hypothetical protein [Agrococcus beijingensis]|uniref:hypothetical protein n=1 Tax=Agrococcus beijingensis TaxID=3068634 RepID=UPI002741EFEE|nr:hypothetical protein [Agrococcus sp. REN33]